MSLTMESVVEDDEEEETSFGLMLQTEDSEEGVHDGTSTDQAPNGNAIRVSTGLTLASSKASSRRVSEVLYEDAHMGGGYESADNDDELYSDARLTNV